MSTLTKLVLGAMGRLRPEPAKGTGSQIVELPDPDRTGGMPLMQAIAQRRSDRAFSPSPLPLTMLSNLLWAAWGINRGDHGRTAPSALDAQEIDLYVAMPEAAYRYDASRHVLSRVADADLRRITGYQDFVDEAALDLVYVADHSRLSAVPVAMRRDYASVCAGAIAQNVYLFAAANGLATVLRAWINRSAIADALGLPHDHEVLLSQTVGLPGINESQQAT